MQLRYQAAHVPNLPQADRITAGTAVVLLAIKAHLVLCTTELMRVVSW